MNWVGLAFGLIREAASTEAGREVLNDLRSATFKRTDAKRVQDVESLKAVVEEHRELTDRNIERIVQMVNAQGDAILETRKRQHIVNFVLIIGIILAIILGVIY